MYNALGGRQIILLRSARTSNPFLKAQGSIFYSGDEMMYLNVVPRSGELLVVAETLYTRYIH